MGAGKQLEHQERNRKNRKETRRNRRAELPCPKEIENQADGHEKVPDKPTSRDAKQTASRGTETACRCNGPT